MPDPPVIILGAGLTGLAAALHLEAVPVLLVEREERVGGKAGTHRRDGFTFDVTGHWLHLRNPVVEELVRGFFAPGELVEIQRRTTVYSHGTMIPYPFQANVHGLPLVAQWQCLLGFVMARVRAVGRSGTSEKFEDFIVALFGKGMARHFFVPYYKKFWGLALDELTSDWLVDYLPRPSTLQVLGGALGLRQDGIGYNARFLYSTSGGVDRLPLAMLDGCDHREDFTVRLSTRAERIDPGGRRIRLSGTPGWQAYDTLVSTIPLTDLIDLIGDVPPEVSAARRALRSIPLRYLNIAVRSISPMREHWVYFPEERFPFYRIGIHTNAVSSMAPSGCSALWVELTDRAGDTDVPAILRSLVDVGAIASADDVLFVEQNDVEHAYAVFDDARERSLAVITSWLARHSIRTCGRYGGWAYGSMEDAIVEGIAAATSILSGRDRDRATF